MTLKTRNENWTTKAFVYAVFVAIVIAMMYAGIFLLVSSDAPSAGIGLVLGSVLMALYPLLAVRSRRKEKNDESAG